jgi:SAM-dependent methyltransferase
MPEAILQAKIEAATAYETLHVPALFEQWASRILDAVSVEVGNRVLDVACGTGVVAREALARVGPEGAVAGVDPDAGMLAVAERLAPHVEWCEGVAASLPHASESFDVVVCQFGMMFFPDRLAALREFGRVLVPRGRVGVAVWDSLERSPAYPIEVALIEEIAGRSAADALRAPFVLGDLAALSSLVESAGLKDVTAATEIGRARFPSLRSMVEADLRGWLPVMGVVLDEVVIQRILGEAESALASYVTADGRAEFDLPAHIVTGTKP